MPDITSETPRTQVTIAGENFTVATPYAEGHVLTANEAAALNQTWTENVRNNLAKAVKDAKEAGSFDAQVFQGTVDDYVNDYEFGVRTGGGRSGDPVRQEAMNIMREQVRKAIKASGKNLEDFSAKDISALAAKNLDSGSPAAAQVLEIARKRVEATKAVSIDIDTSDLTPAEADGEGAKGKKSKAA